MEFCIHFRIYLHGVHKDVCTLYLCVICVVMRQQKKSPMDAGDDGAKFFLLMSYLAATQVYIQQPKLLVSSYHYRHLCVHSG